METELEAKFLNINPGQIRGLLTVSGAKLAHRERLMRRKNFDFPDAALEKIGGWVRLRDEGDKVTLSYKQLLDRTPEGTKEVSIVVDSFDKAVLLLGSIGLVQKSYQETKREKWLLDDVEVTIDTWPWIPTFLELEGQSVEQLKLVASKLNLDWQDALHGSVENAYMDRYKVTEQEVDSWKEILFSDVPDWLKTRAK